jgi:hypothetical protein
MVDIIPLKQIKTSVFLYLTFVISKFMGLIETNLKYFVDFLFPSTWSLRSFEKTRVRSFWQHNAPRYRHKTVILKLLNL